LCCALAQAQVGPLVEVGPPAPFFTPSVSSSYVGPGDLVPNAVAWYGLRAYRFNNALNQTTVASIRRGNDNATSTVALKTDGTLNIASAISFAGSTTCTGTASGSTTLTLTGCTLGLIAGQTLTSTGGTGSFTQPAYCVSVGSFSGGNQTCTMNTAQTVTGVTVTGVYPLYITTLFDQTGNGFNLTPKAPGLVGQPQLLPICVGGLPCMSFSGAQNLGLNGACAITGVPYFMDTVVNQTASSGGALVFAGCYRPGTGEANAIYFSDINTAYIGNGGSLSATASGGVAHSIQNTSAFFGNSTITIDGTDTVGDAGNHAHGDQFGMSIGSGVFPGNWGYLTGYITQAGVWRQPSSAAQRNALCANNKAYWTLAASCTSTPVHYNYSAGPCDVVVCAEAYSMTRAMKNSYVGPLFQLYNGTATLDIGQVPSTRKADMTTWSAFCSGVQSNCKVSRIYAQIQDSSNDLPAANFNPGSNSTSACNTVSYTYCMAPFTIEAATGLPILTLVNPYQYSANLGRGPGGHGPGGFGDDAAAIGINGGMTGSVVYTGAFPTTTACCGVFGIAHKFNDNVAVHQGGTDFMVFLNYGQFSSPIGGPRCTTKTSFCVGADFEALSSMVPREPKSCCSPGPYHGVVMVLTAANQNVTEYINGTLEYSGVITPGMNVHTYIRIGGGGDMSQPAPVLMREGFFANHVLSATEVTNITNNNKAFYSALTFPPP
jgi:hypothetical protein